VLPAVKAGIEAALTPRTVAPRDFGAGVVEFRKVKGVDGDASVGVIRGKKRHIVDLAIEISFAVRVGGSSRDYSGVLELKDLSWEKISKNRLKIEKAKNIDFFRYGGFLPPPPQE